MGMLFFYGSYNLTWLVGCFSASVGTQIVSNFWPVVIAGRMDAKPCVLEPCVPVLVAGASCFSWHGGGWFGSLAALREWFGLEGP